jgi:hypothetical protein
MILWCLSGQHERLEDDMLTFADILKTRYVILLAHCIRNPFLLSSVELQTPGPNSPTYSFPSPKYAHATKR